MENSNMSANEAKVLFKIAECVKIDVPSLAEKTGLSKPTVRAIVDRFYKSSSFCPNVGYVPGHLGLDIMTIYEVSFPAFFQNQQLETHIRDMMAYSNHVVVVIRINPSQILIVALYKDLAQKDESFARMMQYITKKYKEFNPIIKELWTRPSKDFFFDSNAAKFMKDMPEYSAILDGSNKNGGQK